MDLRIEAVIVIGSICGTVSVRDRLGDRLGVRNRLSVRDWLPVRDWVGDYRLHLSAFHLNGQPLIL